MRVNMKYQNNFGELVEEMWVKRSRLGKRKNCEVRLQKKQNKMVTRQKEWNVASAQQYRFWVLQVRYI